MGSASTIISNLKVRFISDDSQLRKSTKQSDKDFQVFKKGLLGTTAVIAGAVAGMMKLTQQAAEYADKMDKASIRTGMARKSMQELAYVADQAGVEYSSIESAMTRLTRAMGDANYGSVRQVAAFEKLGVNIKGANGELRHMTEVFPEVISKLNQIDNETERNALSMELFGRGAQTLVPLLAELGDKGIADLTKKSHELGIVMQDEAIASLVKYKDDLSSVRQQFQAAGRMASVGFAKVMTNAVLPSISAVMSKVNDWLKIPLSESLQEEQEEVNALAIELRSANIEEGRRKEILERLKELSPDVVDGIDAQALSYDTLAKNLRTYNDEMINRIILAKEDEKIQDQAADVGGWQRALATRKNDLINTMQEELSWFKTYRKEAEEIVNDTDLTLMRKGELLNMLALNEKTLGNVGIYNALDYYKKAYYGTLKQISTLNEMRSDYKVKAEELSKLFYEEHQKIFDFDAGDDFNQFEGEYAEIGKQIEKTTDKLLKESERFKKMEQKWISSHADMSNAQAGHITHLMKVYDEVANELPNKLAPISESYAIAAGAARTAYEEVKQINEMLKVTMVEGFTGAIEAAVTGADFGSVTTAFLIPLADMAVQVGKIILLNGIAIEALQKSLTSFTGVPAIIAGTALIAIGTAAKASLKSVGSGGTGNYSPTSSNRSIDTRTSAVQTRPIEIELSGTFIQSGSDLVATVNKENARRKLTT